MSEQSQPAEYTRYICTVCEAVVHKRTSLAIYGTCRECNQGHLRRVPTFRSPA